VPPHPRTAEEHQHTCENPRYSDDGHDDGHDDDSCARPAVGDGRGDNDVGRGAGGGFRVQGVGLILGIECANDSKFMI
jgi:hypothetical protein